MSLKDRVYKAQGSALEKQEKSDEELFSELRHYMNARLSNGLLRMADGNALRVENEIRSLCYEVFSQIEWVSV